VSVVVGHSVVGYATAETVSPGAYDAWWRYAIVAALVANLPDADILVGSLFGDAEGWHHGPSHSLAMAAIVGVATGLLARSAGRRFRPAFAFVGVLYASHVLLDAIAPDRGKPDVGVPLFWPFSHANIAAAIPMPGWLSSALSLREADVAGGYLPMLLSRDTLVVLLTEAVLYAPVLVLALWIRRTRGRSARRYGGLR
jgi:membrane-bound metal-dependent hydrolase YbcI (DUF457 family)